MKIVLGVIALLHAVHCDVSHLNARSTTTATTPPPPPPPRPYAFGYAAGRFPGHIDRTHTEISDGSGTVRGSYSYVDPKLIIRTVDYTADKDGFHPVLNSPQSPLPRDSAVVAAAKEKHLRLYAAIASKHQEGVPEYSLPHDTASVEYAKAKHFDLFQRIAEQHAQIAAEREAERAAADLPNIVLQVDTPHL